MRIWIVTELGAMSGHVQRCLALAQQLLRESDAAFEITVYTSQAPLQLARHAPGMVGLRILQCESRQAVPQTHKPLITPAETLATTAFIDPDDAADRCRWWLDQIDTAQSQRVLPHVVIADNAPYALLAACSRNIPVVRLGSGVDVIPAMYPQPGYYPGQPVSELRLIEADKLLVAQANQTLALLKLPQITQARDLVRGSLEVIANFEPLDVFAGQAKNGNSIHAVAQRHYIGPLLRDLTHPLKVPTWQQRTRQAQQRGARPHAFVYLRPGVTGATHALEALAALNYTTTVVGMETDASTADSAGHASLTSTQLVDWRMELARAHVAVLYGGAGMLSACALTGTPCLVLPQYMEQISNSMAAAQAGLAVVNVERTRAALQTQLQQIPLATHLHDGALALQQRYGQHSNSVAAKKLIQLLDSLVATD